MASLDPSWGHCGSKGEQEHPGVIGIPEYMTEARESKKQGNNTVHVNYHLEYSQPKSHIKHFPYPASEDTCPFYSPPICILGLTSFIDT